MEKVPKIFKFCLTGGPCAGKTTAISYLQDKLSPYARVFSVPEVATMTVMSGYPLLEPLSLGDDHVISFQSELMKQIMHTEDYFYQLSLLQTQNAVLICDRGTLDTAAYISDSQFKRLLEMNNWNKHFLSHSRYDAIVHLVTAAHGAENYYTLANNIARTESPELARTIDNKILKAWSGHPHHYVVDNDISQGFSGKLERTLNIVKRVIGFPDTAFFVKKYLLDSSFTINKLPEDIDYKTYETFCDYLYGNEPGVLFYLVRRMQDGAMTYAYIRRQLEEDESKRVEIRRNISRRMYEEYLLRKDLELKMIKKKCYSFFHEKLHLTIECTEIQGENLFILRVESDKIVDKTKLPSYFPITSDITENNRYYSRSLAGYQYQEYQKNQINSEKKAQNQ